MTFDKLALRKWLNIYEAAQYLSWKIGSPCGENGITDLDVLRFAIDGDLPLVVNLPTGTKDRAGLEVEGLWDLLMEGERGEAGRQQVECEYHDQANLPFIDMEDINGAWVERDGVRRQLQPMSGSTGIYPTSPSALSEGSVLAVRREALDALASKMPAPSAPASTDFLDRPLGERERATLLTVIAALAETAGVDLSQPTKASGQIEAMTIQTLKTRIPARTVESHLKAIPDALERRGKTSN